MAIIWDAPLCAAVARELHSRLRGARLRGHIFDWDRREMALFFRSGTLRWNLHPQAGWVTIHPPEDLPGMSRPLSAELVGVRAPPDERLLRFSFRKARGRTRSVQVVVELMTNQWNALLTEGEQEWIRHLLWTRRPEGRALVVGHRYEPPGPSARRGIEKPLSLEEWIELTQGASEGKGSEAILGQLAFSSILNLPALQEEGTGYPLWLRIRSLETSQPCLLETTRGQQPYPIALNGFKLIRYSSLLDAFQGVAGTPVARAGSAEELSDRLDRALHQARGRVRGIEREMAQAANPEETREKADLLLARLSAVKRGAARVTLTDFKGNGVTLALDPSLTPHQNADVLYREAARQERAAERLPALLARARSRVRQLATLREKLLAGEVSVEEAQALLPGATERKWAHTGETRLPFRRFRSSGGLEIRVGRGSADNDDLTFGHARPDDVWLHARGSAGAHVILRWSGKGAPPSRDLSEAAALAALHSRDRGAGVVPVDWTRRKYVRKPRKAPPGSVVTDRTQTLFVNPDPALLERLAWEG